MKYLLLLIISGALAVSGFGQTRNVLVGTNNAVVQPTNFWSADASNARTGLGLGSAATNPASSFQPSSLALSNLSANNGGELTNLNSTNIVGTLSVAQGGTGSTNASDARTALGLGTASTNLATAFQSSSATLSNLATANGGSLTNLQAASLVGAIPSSNIPSFTFTNLSGTLSVAQGGTGATNAANARQNLGSTTVGDALFVATDAAAARTALALGTAATSASTAFQPANANLTNLSTNNGASLTGIPISGIVNLQSNLDTKLATNGNGSGLTSLTAANINGTVALASNITGTAPLATNVTGIVALANGGTGATNDTSARTALGATTVGGNLFTLINPSAIRFIRLNADNTATALSASDFRTAIGLSTAATNAESAFQPASTNLTTLSVNNGVNLTNIPLAGVVGALATNGSAAGLTGFVGTTNAATARANLGLGWSALTNTDSTSFRNTIGLGTTNNVTFNSIQAGQTASSIVYTLAFGQTNTGFRGIGGGPSDFGFYRDGSPIWYASGSGLSVAVAATFSQPLQLNYGAGSSAYISFSGVDPATGAAISRTNLGLPWSGLTNTNAATFQTALFGANTNPVLVDTNGEVVNPTNFWQAAPITTTFIESQPTTNSTTNITAARFLHIHSLNSNIFNVTNTIALPTNGSTFNGDIALVVHQGPTNSMTRVRSVGSTNDIATMTRYNEAIEFVYYNNAWQFNHNEAFTEPVYFAGTNAAANAAASRTNLGLGTTNNVTFSNISASGTLTATGVVTATTNLNVGGAIAVTNSAQTRTNLGIPLVALTNTNNADFRNAIELGATNDVTFNNVTASGTLTSTGAVTFVTNLSVGGAIAVTNAAETRTNLGIPLSALTNTNNVEFQAAVFNTNTAPTNTANVNGVGFNTAVGWMDVTLNIGGTNQVFRIPLFQ